MRDPDAAPPPRWQLKAWLLGGAEIATTAALFDEADYRGDIKGDLFGDERFFCDAEQFWQLQNAAIAKLRDDLTAKGWQAVHVIGPAERFQAWGHEPVPKAKGGAAYHRGRAQWPRHGSQGTSAERGSAEGFARRRG